MLRGKVFQFKITVHCFHRHKMNFVTNGTDKMVPRLGHVVLGTEDNSPLLSTPCCLLYTRKGTVPHLTKDVLELVTEKNHILHLNVATMASLRDSTRKYQNGVASFLGYKNHMTYLSIYDSAIKAKSGCNTTDSCCVWDLRQEKMQLDVMKYTHLILDAFKPNWFQALCDSDTHYGSSKKRICKAVDRSLTHLDACLLQCNTLENIKHCKVFGTIEGGYDLAERIRSAKETALRPVAGFVLEGFITHDSDDADAHFDEILQIIREVVNVLPPEKPRIMHGPWNPYETLQLIEMGIDITDSSYVYNATEKGVALTFEFDFNAVNPDELLKFQNLTSPDTAITYGIDLREKRFFNDFTPILETCQCYSCRTYTRAYVHHLLTASELLASVLLMVHNLSHYFKYMETISDAIRCEKFSNLKAAVLMSKR